MLYLKLSGRIVTVTATVTTDNAVIQSLRKELSEGFVEESVIRGETLFAETGLLTDETFGYHLELVEIEDLQPGETFRKLVRPDEVNYFYDYPKPYTFENGEYLAYTIEEFTGSLYAEMPGLEYEGFDVKDLYVGELVLDDVVGNCGLLSEIYYVPLEDAESLANASDIKSVRSRIIGMLKNGETDDLKYYRLNLEHVDGEFVYHVIKSKNGELFNDWSGD